MRVSLVPPREHVNRVRSEYLEMPGLVLTGVQARRLWNLDDSVCEAVLAVLVDERFLAQSSSGGYLRVGAV